MHTYSGSPASCPLPINSRWDAPFSLFPTGSVGGVHSLQQTQRHSATCIILYSHCATSYRAGRVLPHPHPYRDVLSAPAHHQSLFEFHLLPRRGDVLARRRVPCSPAFSGSFPAYYGPLAQAMTSLDADEGKGKIGTYGNGQRTQIRALHPVAVRLAASQTRSREGGYGTFLWLKLADERARGGGQRYVPSDASDSLVIRRSHVLSFARSSSLSPRATCARRLPGSPSGGVTDAPRHHGVSLARSGPMGARLLLHGQRVYFQAARSGLTLLDSCAHLHIFPPKWHRTFLSLFSSVPWVPGPCDDGAGRLSVIRSSTAGIRMGFLCARDEGGVHTCRRHDSGSDGPRCGPYLVPSVFLSAPVDAAPPPPFPPSISSEVSKLRLAFGLQYTAGSARPRTGPSQESSTWLASLRRIGVPDPDAHTSLPVRNRVRLAIVRLILIFPEQAFKAHYHTGTRCLPPIDTASTGTLGVQLAFLLRPILAARNQSISVDGYAQTVSIPLPPQAFHPAVLPSVLIHLHPDFPSSPLPSRPIRISSLTTTPLLALLPSSELLLPSYISCRIVANQDAQAAFNRCKFGIFASLAYPTAGPGHFRVACDLMNLFFVFDKKSDPPRIYDEKLLEAYIASGQDEGRVRSIAEYLEVRRGTIGIRPSFDFILLTEDLSDEVVEHPHIQKLALAAIDLNILVNQSREDDVHNMATVAMREMKLGFQEAVDHVGAQFRGIARAFCEDMKAMPEFPHPLDRLAAEYVAGMGLSVYTNVKWSFA
ncbi:hypothetical protein B0H13DRAFT_2364962 [Mycena leptocephala]|nr:hypothetical protein B0H13DRAFT_2364962 [Mycena leptocephala]